MRVLFSLFCCVILAACGTSIDGNYSKTVSTQLDNLSFSTQLASANIVTIDGHTPPSLPWSAVNTAQLRGLTERVRLYGAKDLTSADKRRLGLLLQPGGIALDYTSQLLGDLNHFYGQYGRLPRSGAELVAFTQRFSRLERLFDKSPQEQFNTVAFAVNPLTGRLYQAFDVDRWSPGGIYVQRIANSDAIHKLVPHSVVFPENPSQPRGSSMPIGVVWKIRIYGERPGSVIYEGMEIWPQLNQAYVGNLLRLSRHTNP